MISFDDIKRQCMLYVGGSTRLTGTVELYDTDARKRNALASLKRNMIYFQSLGNKYQEFRKRVEFLILSMQPQCSFLMEKRLTREEWRVNNVEELMQALREGYTISTASQLPHIQNPCGEISLDRMEALSFRREHGGSPFQKQLSASQLRLVARAVWRRLYMGNRDSVVIEALPHIKISKTVMTKLNGHLKLSSAIELIYAFYNQSRQPQWWSQLRSYRINLRDDTNVQMYALMVADYLYDALGPQKSIPNEFKTSTVMGILRSMRESEDFSTMPILADALQDAGCEDIELLSHYRLGQTFSLGSWIFRATGLI